MVTVLGLRFPRTEVSASMQQRGWLSHREYRLKLRVTKFDLDGGITSVGGGLTGWKHSQDGARNEALRTDVPCALRAAVMTEVQRCHR